MYASVVAGWAVYRPVPSQPHPTAREQMHHLLLATVAILVWRTPDVLKEVRKILQLFMK